MEQLERGITELLEQNSRTCNIIRTIPTADKGEYQGV
jgi:hypothetical protein